MTKQEYIQQAYGEYWDKVKGFVDSNGWLSFWTRFDTENMGIIFDERIVPSGINLRPSSLKGIENNNDWISINNTTCPKPSDFLNETRVLCYKEGVKEVICDTFNEYWRLQRDFGRFTHYQLIEEPKPPLYD